MQRSRCEKRSPNNLLVFPQNWANNIFDEHLLSHWSLITYEALRLIVVNNAGYKGYNVGEYYADLIVDDTVILELKAAEALVRDFEYQLINYLRATNMEVGLLLNFGPKPEFRRKVFSNNRKNLS